MRPVASLSLDLDNEWSYLKTRGDASWQSLPSYLDVVVPRVLDELARRLLRITVFVVGQDAALPKNHAALASIASAGHEIGNHSFRHEPWLHRYSEPELDEELARAEEAILQATGARTRGFRGPGYSLSQETLRVLVRRGYEYDASTLPTYLGPLARAVYFRKTALQADERRDRDLLFGTFGDGRRPLKPYRWRVDDAELLELPVTTLPGIKVPMHVSYVLWLAGYSPRIAIAYFRNALRLCKLVSVEPSILLHPLDFLGPDDVPSLSFFPGMGTALADKLRVTGACLNVLNESFDVQAVGEHAAGLADRSGLRLVEPQFAEVAEGAAA